MRPGTVRDVLDLLEASVPAAALGAALEPHLFELLAAAGDESPLAAGFVVVEGRRVDYPVSQR